MSVEAITWALKQDVQQSSAKFVLVVLANSASGDGDIAFPSAKYIAKATSQDRKTVVANLKRLCDAGLISDTGQRVGMTKQVIVYKLNLAFVAEEKRNSSENGTVPETDANSPVFPPEESRFSSETVPKTGHGTVMEPSVTVTSNQKKRAGSLPDMSSFDFSAWPSIPDAQVFTDWLALRKAKRAPLSETVMREMGRQMHAAVELGFELDAALSTCVLRNWQGFKAQWLLEKPNGVSNGTDRPNSRESVAARAERLFNEGEARDAARYQALGHAG